MRLDRFLTEALAAAGKETSRSQLQKWIESGLVACDGVEREKVKPSYTSKISRRISVTAQRQKDQILKPLAVHLPVLFEDKYLAVIHKPPGMTVHPGAGTGEDTLVHALLANIDALAPHAERPGIVHRLDRETEGLMLIAKTALARTRLAAAFAEREIHKSYSAVVWGAVTLPEAIEGYIWRDVHDRKKMRFGENVPERIGRAREAALRITAQEQKKYGTALAVELITGRTHQIRATMRYFNAPVVGDAVYGSDAARAKVLKLGREKSEALARCGMLLMARGLEFVHPFTHKRQRFALPLPQRFNDALQALQAEP